LVVAVAVARVAVRVATTTARADIVARAADKR